MSLRQSDDDVDGGTFGVDVFEGPLVGLLLCSIESDTLEELERLAVPRYAGFRPDGGCASPTVDVRNAMMCN